MKGIIHEIVNNSTSKQSKAEKKQTKEVESLFKDLCLGDINEDIFSTYENWVKDSTESKLTFIFKGNIHCNFIVSNTQTLSMLEENHLVVRAKAALITLGKESPGIIDTKLGWFNCGTFIKELKKRLTQDGLKANINQLILAKIFTKLPSKDDIK
jgi:hypothetical protein